MKMLVSGRSLQILCACTFCAVALLATHVLKHPIIAVVLALAPFGLLVVVKRPFWLILGFVIFSFFRIHEVFPQLYPLRIPQLLALASIMAIGWAILSGRLALKISREHATFLVFFALVTVGLMFATNRGAAMGNWTGSYVKIAIMTFAITWLATGPRDFRLTAWVVIAAGIIVAAVALHNKANGLELVEGTRVTIGRSIGSMLGDPNDLSLVLLFPASFALALLLTRGSGWASKLYGLIAFCLIVAAVIATQSRGGLLGILAVSGVFGYRLVRNKVLLFAVGGVALMVLVAAAGISSRASGGAHEEGIDESAMGRIYAWQAAMSMAVHNPVTGVGLDNFIENYWEHSPHWDGKNHAVHSTWFGVLGETGLVGFIAFVTMVVVTVRSALWCCSVLKPDPGTRPGRDEVAAYVMAQAVLSGLAGFCVSGTFLTMGFTWPVYVLLALTAAVANYARQKRLSYCDNNIKNQ
jgi:probable O-glycosylation ligase (exosortase A-associated)